MNAKIAVLLFCSFLLACTVESSPTQLPSQIMQVVEGQSILIRLDQGEVIIRGGEAGQVRVDGQMLFPDKTDYDLTKVNRQIQITVSYTGNRSSNPAVYLDVSIPNDIPLNIESEFASIVVREYQGKLEASSVSGDISIQSVYGTILARSSRGDVSVQDTAGDISVVGNYGSLTLEDTSGDIGVSTIMGTITFNGSVRSSDNVRLETDHGPVVVHLSPDSALNLQVRSNSGDVACMLPDISSSLRTCDGEFNFGGGPLTVRTVSGPVTVQLVP